tara:strand:+ start:186 stop:3158 length:2973 start_codon:yes stop_codon:yes gene_type:complete
MTSLTRLSTRVSAVALATVICMPAFAQDAPLAAQETGQAVEPDQNGDQTEIVVTASRQRGSVDTDVPPVIELSEADIASYGADSLGDLIAQLGPQTGSGRGRGDGHPVILVNGQRIGNFRELRRYPPEAIEKVEVFPEEVALQYGYPADQRVINFILKDNFKAREVEVEYGRPLAGGTGNGEIELSQLSISGPRRINIAAEFNTSSMLTEAERDIEQTPGTQPTVATDPDPAAYRSLQGESESYELEGSFNTAIGEGANAKAISANLSAARNYSRSLSGLEIVTLTDGTDSEVRAVDGDPLTRRTRSTTISGGGAYRQRFGDFDFDATLDGTYSDSESDIDRRRDLSVLQEQVDAGLIEIDGPLPVIPGVGADRSNSTTYTLNSLATLRGTPLLLPGGEVNMTLDGGYKWNRIESDDTRNALGAVQLTRGRINGGLNLGIPLTSRREGFLDAIGDLTLNAAFGVDQLSDFGTLTDLTLGLTWNVTDRLTLGATWINSDAAPSLTELGAPTVQTFNVPVFDFATGDSVLATVTTGGNAALPASNQNDFKLSANYDLDLFERTSILVEFFDNNARNTTESFPLLTADIEAAFPDRVRRNGAGTLTALDQTPITYAKRNSRRLRYGINLFGKVGKARVEEESRGGGGGRPDEGDSVRPPAEGTSGPPSSGAARMGPEQFQQMRQQFCASEPGTVPDLSQLPPFIRERLTNEDGSVNEERLAQARERMCSTDAAGGPGGPGGFDPEQVAAIREALCAAPETPVDLAKLPEGLRKRLTNEDGTVNEERLARLRTAICQADGSQAGEGQGKSGEGQRRGGGRRGGGGPFGGGDGQGRWSLGLYHTIEFENTALIAPGVPELDFLDGNASGQSGGISRHQVELEGGLFFEGVGARLSGKYQGPTRVDGTDATGSQDLYFGDLVTFDLRLFANLEQQKWLTGETPGFFKGARLSIRVDNLFDTRQDVVDGNGVTPTRFQPALIDPLGRTVSIEFRKLF